MEKGIREAADKKDKEIEEANNKIKEEVKPAEEMSKLYDNKGLMLISLFAAIVNGALQPVFALFLSKLLATLTAPFIYIRFKEITEGRENIIKEDVTETVIIMAIVAVICFFTMTQRKIGFAKIGAHVTFQIR